MLQQIITPGKSSHGEDTGSCLVWLTGNMGKEDAEAELSLATENLGLEFLLNYDSSDCY